MSGEKFLPEDIIEHSGANQGNLTREGAEIEGRTVERIAKEVAAKRGEVTPDKYDYSNAERQVGGATDSKNSTSREIQKRAAEFAKSQNMSKQGQAQFVEETVEGYYKARKEQPEARAAAEAEELKKRASQESTVE